MTTTPELPDLDKLEALARAATPGPWSLAKVIDRTIEHLCPVDRDRLSLLTVVHEGETPYGAVFRDEDAKFMAGIHPEQVLALIALARRARPYATGGDVPGGLHLAGEGLRPLCGQPESGATQAAPLSEVQIDRIARAYFSEQWAVQHAKDAIHDAFQDARKSASLWPLCGAQPAESGKETAQLSIGFANNDQGVHVSVMQQHSDGAVTLLHQAKVPAGDSFTRFAVAAQQAAAPGALYSYMGESGRYELIGQAVGAGRCRLIDPLTVYRDTATGSLYFRHPSDFAARMVAIKGNAPSAQGAPEAPQTAAARDVLAERQRQIQVEGWKPEHDDAYTADQLPRAAHAYILGAPGDPVPRSWPWSGSWWKPRDARANYVRAGALLMAEIERLDRAAAPKAGA